MFFSLFISIFLLINFPQILSIRIGKIHYSSIRSNSPIYSSSNINCTDCLCDCFDSLSCSGINCFPLNYTCQLIERRPWIFESDLSINFTSNNFVEIKENTSHLCSCYTPKKLLDYYGQINLTNYATTTNIRSIKYIPNDDTLIVLNYTLIRKLSAKNLNIILRNLSVLGDSAMSILHNDTKIYIAFTYNRSINMYDLNLTLLQTSIGWLSQVGSFGEMFLLNNQILIVDIWYAIIWSINSFSQTSLTIFFSFSSYNILNPNGLFINQNQLLYISTYSKNLYLFNLTDFTLIQIISLSVDVVINSMRYDTNCNRLWFGTQNYIYAPILDLATNQMNIYTTTGIISKYGIYSIDFNANYMVFYASLDQNLRQIYLPDINC